MKLPTIGPLNVQEAEGVLLAAGEQVNGVGPVAAEGQDRVGRHVHVGLRGGGSGGGVASAARVGGCGGAVGAAGGRGLGALRHQPLLCQEAGTEGLDNGQRAGVGEREAVGLGGLEDGSVVALRCECCVGLGEWQLPHVHLRAAVWADNHLHAGAEHGDRGGVGVVPDQDTAAHVGGHVEAVE